MKCAPDDPIIVGGAAARPDFPSWLEVVTPSFNWRWPYLRYLDERLQRVTDGTLKKLMVFMPPRHGKSSKTTIRYPIYRMECDPAMRVCIGCYNQQFAEKFGRAARRIARQRLTVSDERSAAREWETTAGGVYRSCGVGSPPTGEGFDLICIDDPTKSREEAESVAYQERTWDWYSDDLMTRKEPNAAVILIATRWHEGDLPGRILSSPDAKNWEVVRLPALAEDNDPLGRAPGQALCPERYDERAMAEKRVELSGYSWESLFQQNPTARDGAFFHVSKLEVVDVPPAFGDTCRGWDAAATAAGGDYTAGVKLRAKDGVFYVVDVVRGQWDTAKRNAIVRETAERDGEQCHQHFEQEGGSGGKDQAAAFLKLCAGYPCSATPSSGTKEVRADPFSAQVNAGNVRMVRGPWNAAFKEELRQFPGGVHDDQVDGAGRAFNYLSRPRNRVFVW